jgi:hypothetical protein
MTSLPRWVEIVMLSIYGDESADEKKERVFAVSGLLGSKSEWEGLKSKWLKRTGGQIFHAAECESPSGKSADCHKENLQLYADLANIIGNSSLYGLGIAISIKDYNELIASALDENPYYLCFVEVIVRLARKASFYFPPDRVEVIFDNNLEVDYNAGLLYSRLVRSVEEHREYMQLLQDKISFASRKELEIQAADLVAREAMKLVDNEIGPILYRYPRMSARALAEKGRVRFIKLDRKWCERMIADSTNYQYPKAPYFEWLKQKGISNSLSNRMRYEKERGMNETKL